jgi:hypothetical protein
MKTLKFSRLPTLDMRRCETIAGRSMRGGDVANVNIDAAGPMGESPVAYARFLTFEIRFRCSFRYASGETPVIRLKTSEK